MAFPGFSFYGNEWDLDTYGGDGGFSAFGNPPEDWMPDMSGIQMPTMAPPSPQRRPLTVDDLYPPQVTVEQAPDYPSPASMRDLTDEQRKQLRADILLQAGLAISQGAGSRGGIAAALGQAAQGIRAGQEQALASENKRRQSEYERSVAEAMAKREAAQAEAQDAQHRQAANSLTGMANKIAETEPQVAELADTYARMGQMDDLVKLYQQLPKYAQARAAGFDPFAQPDWEAQMQAKQEQEQEAAKRAADLADWETKQRRQLELEAEQRRQFRDQGLLWAPPEPREPKEPKPPRTLETAAGVFEQAEDGSWRPVRGIPPPAPKGQEPKLPRIIRKGEGLDATEYYEDAEKGVLYPIFPDELGNRTPIPMPGWKPPGARRPAAKLDKSREAPTQGNPNRPAADRGERPTAQKEPSREQVERKLSLVSQSFGPLTSEQEAFVRDELRKGQTAQSILARIRMAMSGGSRG